jgi:predicted nucleic acid-binding protein
MHADVVLDSGTIAALFFNDPSSEKVEADIVKYRTPCTLDLAFAEICNVAWKRVTFFGENIETSAKALALARDFINNACQVFESKELVQQAFHLAVEEGTTAYDALYLSLAKTSNSKLLTTDEKLHRKVDRSSKISGLTRIV